MQIHLEKKFSYYVFLRITEVVEVTQEINSTGIIPLEALRMHLPKRPHSIFACCPSSSIRQLAISVTVLLRSR